METYDGGLEWQAWTKSGFMGQAGVIYNVENIFEPLDFPGDVTIPVGSYAFAALTGEFSSSIYGIAIFLFVGVAMGVIGLSLEPKPEKRNYLVLPLLLFFNVFLDGIRIMSTVEDVINIVMEWEKPKR